MYRRNDDPEEMMSMLQDVLDDVLLGRTENHKCPFCGKATLDVEAPMEYGEVSWVRISCPGCGRTFEGQVR